MYDGEKKIADFTDVTAIRAAANDDLAVLTEQSLHLCQSGKWVETKLSPNEKVIGLAFSPTYPEDDSLLLATVRQGSRTSIVRFESKVQGLDRLFDFDAKSRWITFAAPAGYKVDVRRPAAFFAGTGGFVFRPSWPFQDWQRDVIHDADATVLSVALSPEYPEQHVVAIGTTTGVIYSENDGLLWLNTSEGMEDRRALKVMFASPTELYCLTPTRIYRSTPS